MINIARPEFNVREVFTECISTVEDRDLQQDLANCVNALEAAEIDYISKFPNAAIHKILQSRTVLGRIGSDQMKTVYNYRMVGEGMPGRKYYDLIKAAAPFGTCPLCTVRDVDTIDHYLPKMKFPVFAVTPITLIPACTRCNKGKNIEFPTRSEEQTLNPYFDDVENTNWVNAVVIPGNPVTFDYRVIAVNDWTDILNSRVAFHFKAFHLNELFSTHANKEYRGIKRQLTGLFNDHPDLLKAHLWDGYLSRLELGVNSWEAVMYLALYNDEWFCNGGFIEI
jgi:hypothetical protein